jgi:hypothetical protein
MKENQGYHNKKNDIYHLPTIKEDILYFPQKHTKKQKITLTEF